MKNQVLILALLISGFSFAQNADDYSYRKIETHYTDIVNDHIIEYEIESGSGTTAYVYIFVEDVMSSSSAKSYAKRVMADFWDDYEGKSIRTLVNSRASNRYKDAWIISIVHSFDRAGSRDYDAWFDVLN